MTNTNQYIAFDTETERISYHTPIPDIICLQHATVGESRGVLWTPWETPLDVHFSAWVKRGIHLIGHNITYDLSVLAWKYPHLITTIFAAYDAGQIHDTLLREKLLNITLHGELEVMEVNGASIKIGYKLSDLEKKYLGIDRSELKDDEDSPRMNYSMMKGKPLAEWPEIFISYAVDDAINTAAVFAAQEEERKRCIETIGYDPFVTEEFRSRAAWGLRLLECVGTLLDGDKVREVAEEFTREYNKPSLRDPLIAAGLLLPEQPAAPYANKAVDHLPTCAGHKDHSDYKKGRKIQCACPLKMKAAKPEKSPTKPLFQYIWSLAKTKPNLFKAWPSDGCAKDLKAAGVYDQVISDGAFTLSFILNSPEIPDDVKLKTDEEWVSNFAPLDPLLSIWQERKTLRKIVTDYLPKLYYTDPETGISEPAKIIRAAYNPMVKSGRCSSYASKLYPSRNDQNADPRIRPCSIPRPGNLFASSDYSGMELGTLAQRCFNLFGFSDLGDKINKDIDTHAYLAAQIACSMDQHFAEICSQSKCTTKDDIFSLFSEAKNMKKEPCEDDLPEFCKIYRTTHTDYPKDKPVTWANFFKHYRTFAKPTGLGYPGGLGAETFISYAKATFGVLVDLDTAKHLKDIWLETYTEMGPYLEYVSKHLKDPHHSTEEYEDEDGKIKSRIWYFYDTPRGMHRPKCSFCEAANGSGLQSFSAEGALEALYRVQRAMWLDVIPDCITVAFIHDELLWELPDDGQPMPRVRAVEKMMIDAMQELTPDVKAGAQTALMRRWYKQAEPVMKDGVLVPWEPEEKQ